jgi:prepilin-type N-terminal cleavage/methylation domain-containing protein
MSVLNKNQQGFTLVEIVIACVILPIIVVGISNTFDAVRKSYRITRQLNEIYTVLSACPEIDRALEFSSLTSGTNCYPNNAFAAEGGSGNTLTYTPTLTVTDTSALSVGDPLRTIPDSKVVDVNVGYIQDTGGAPLRLRLLITRNGVAQQ